MASNGGEASVDGMERLMEELPRMAEAVNAFTSTEVQQLAFKELIREFRGEEGDADEAGEATVSPDAGRRRRRRRARPKTAAEADTTGNGRQRTRASAPTSDKTLDLNPKGKTSFEDFVAEKEPKDTFHDHNIVAVYWLKQVAEVGPVTYDKVYTCYRGRGWKLPTHFRTKLQQTASSRAWLDTADGEDIKITPQGINYVERDLPSKPKPAK